MKENLVSSKLLEKSKKDIKTILQRVKGALSSLPNVEEDGIADLNAVLNMFFTPTFISQFLDVINRAHVPSDYITIPQFEASLKCLWLCQIFRVSPTVLFELWDGGVQGGCMEKPEGFDESVWSRLIHERPELRARFCPS